MSSEIGAGVESAVERARKRWPGIGCARDDLLRHVEGLGTRCGDLDLFGDELCLACASLHGDELAVRVLDRDYVGRIAPSLTRLGTHEDFVEEVTQLLRQRLLLPPDPRIAAYAATGPLLAWVRVVALRLGLGLRRSAPPAPHELQAEHLLDEPRADASEFPRYRDALDAAVRRAFANLELRERNLLRLHYLDGLNLDKLGQLYGVHRATAARWLADLRRGMLEEIQEDVRQHLNITPSEFRSVLLLIQSHLDASVNALLGAIESAP
jgi:RNA polymerase sigma-70 factor (ECF subfamily)